MNDPLVSVITPAYNHAPFIAACIESVLAQSYENWELVVVDDGSSDATWEIVQSFADRDSRIRAYRQANSGIWNLGRTYNWALAQCNGQLVAILEGDDYWPSDKLAVQVSEHRDDPDLLLSYGQVALVRNGRTVGHFPVPSLQGRHESIDFLRLAFLRTSALMSISIVVKREALDNIGGFRQEANYPAVDYPTWLRVLEQPGAVVYLNQVVGFWRHHDSQVTRSLGVEMAEASRDIALKHFRELPHRTRQQLAIDEHDILSASRPNLADAYFGRLRWALQARNSQAARASLPAVWHYGNTKRKVQAAYGLVAQRCGWDMELFLAPRVHRVQ